MLLLKNANDYPIGHRCDCGKVHEWPMYVFAHMNNHIKHTCDCGIESDIYHGNIEKQED